MIGLLQRVSEASVEIDGKTVGSIAQGLLVLVGVEQGDADSQAERLAKRVANYRVFSDENGKMNLNVEQINGGVLIVPQFTLVADTDHGNRPGFSRAAEPETSRRLFDHMVAALRRTLVQVETGRFGADMQVTLCNDGPVTISLRVNPHAETVAEH